MCLTRILDGAGCLLQKAVGVNSDHILQWVPHEEQDVNHTGEQHYCCGSVWAQTWPQKAVSYSCIFSGIKSLQLHLCHGTRNCVLAESWHRIIRALCAHLFCAPVSVWRRYEQWCWRELWCVAAGLICYLRYLGFQSTLQNAATLQYRQYLFVLMLCLLLNSWLKATLLLAQVSSFNAPSGSVLNF